MKQDDAPGGAVAPHAARRPWSDASPPDWAAGQPHPAWLALREGTRPIVFFAPHGGRRLRPIRRGDSVNDLETAAIAWELAERLDAHAIVNHGLDRNEIDLNRITHLAGRAPGVLALLRHAIEAASAGGDVPLVLFVHGWNMVVPCCDIGMGLRRRAGHVTGRYPTLGRRRFDTTIAVIEEELQARGVSASIGRRYTASGRDNAAQLFSGRHLHHEQAEVAALARLSVEERVDAAQLELGIPLRWNGPLRDAFVEGLVAALTRDGRVAGQATAIPADSAEHAAAVPRTAGGWRLEPRAADDVPGAVEPGYAFQAVLDPASGLATFCGVESTGPRSMAARFSLVFTDGSMMLLVGEGEWNGERGHYRLEGFDWRVTDGGARMEVSLHAPMIRYPTHEAYLDLEQGLAASRLVRADVHLVVEALSEEHATVRGRVQTLGRTWEVDTTGFLDRGGRRGTSVEPRIRVVAARSTGEVIVARSLMDPGATLEMDTEAGARGVIRGLSSEAGEHPLQEAEVLARVPVWRPLGDGTLVRWTFGMVRCRFTDGGPDSVGLFDCTDVFGVPAPTLLDEDESSA